MVYNDDHMNTSYKALADCKARKRAPVGRRLTLRGGTRGQTNAEGAPGPKNDTNFRCFTHIGADLLCASSTNGFLLDSERLPFQISKEQMSQGVFRVSLDACLSMPSTYLGT